MSIRRDNHKDSAHQARVDRMINEFRDAQSRRFGKPNGNVDDTTLLDANLKAPRLTITISPLASAQDGRG